MDCTDLNALDHDTSDGHDIEVAFGFQKHFATALIAALQDRFQDNNIVSCFKIFNPREVPSTPMGMRDWGSSELEQLLRFYSENKVLETGKPMEAQVTAGAVKGEFRAFKIQCMIEWRDKDFHSVAHVMSFSPSFQCTDSDAAREIFVKALELWKGATSNRFLYSNPSAHLNDLAGSMLQRDPERRPQNKAMQIHNPKVCVLVLDKRSLIDLRLRAGISKAAEDAFLYIVRADAAQLIRLMYPGLVKVIQGFDVLGRLKSLDNVTNSPKELQNLVGLLQA
ncbi:hypothetical protein R1sor_018796 [Riccia sorocarpa]|uniref:Uncharacterized protein n=1 Tax=Riccia sorocarpa TaxID=122646 RepID=A0ABD3IGY1_9MARC